MKTGTQRLLRLLLLLYPAALRRRWGGEMLHFLSLQRTELRYAGPGGRWRFLREVVMREAWTAIRMRLGRAVETRCEETVGGGSDPVRSTPRRAPFTNLIHDLAFGIRSLSRAPLYSLAALATLALGIGATTAVFSVVHGVVIKPLDYPNADRLVRVWRTSRGEQDGEVSWPDLVDWQASISRLEGLAGFIEQNRIVEWRDAAEELFGASVTANLFSVIGVEPILGRGFTPEEDRFGGASAVILSHGLWQERFAGSREVLDRSLLLDGESVPIVGVMPPGFDFPFPNTRFWTPLQEERLLVEVGLPRGGRSLSFIQVVGRLAPGVTLDQAEREIVEIAERIDRAERPERLDLGVRLESLHEATVGSSRQTLVLLLGAVALVLLVACANVANLSLTRLTGRRAELSARAALGADRSRLVRQLGIESLLLALGGGVLGTAIALGLTRWLVALAPSEIPRIAAVEVDGPVLLFSLSLVLLSTLLFGILPALRAARTASALGRGARGVTQGGGSLALQRALVSGQVGLAVLLLCGAVLLGDSLRRLLDVDPGFARDRVTVARLSPPTAAYETPEQIDTLYASLLERIRSLPGVVAASATYSPPFAQNEFSMSIVPEGAEEDSDALIWVGTVIVRDDYFRSVGVPLLQGREFDSSDRLDSPPVAIVNQTMAAELWPGDDALGKRFRFSGGISGSADSLERVFLPKDFYTVVGVAADVRRAGLAEPPRAEFYRPHKQMTWAGMYLTIRTDSYRSDLPALLREVVREEDRSIPIADLSSLERLLTSSLETSRFRTQLLVAFAATALTLALLGVHAVVALFVARRRREIGIRLALGAPRRQVHREVVLEGVRLAVTGTAVGLSAAFLLRRAIASMLFGVSTESLVVYASVALTALVTTALACALPARRASNVDPVRTLAAE